MSAQAWLDTAEGQLWLNMHHNMLRYGLEREWFWLKGITCVGPPMNYREPTRTVSFSCEGEQIEVGPVPPGGEPRSHP